MPGVIARRQYTTHDSCAGSGAGASVGRRFSSNRVHRSVSEVYPAGMQESMVSGRTPIYTQQAHLSIRSERSHITTIHDLTIMDGYIAL